MKGSSKFLPDDVQKAYIKQAQAGSEDAKNIIIDNNRKLVASLAQRFCGRGLDKEDLVQIGMIGLLKAINNFNVNCENKFTTYAVPMVVGEIKRALRDDQPIHVSRSYKEIGYKIHREREHFVHVNNREPTIGELAGELGLPPDKIAVALEANQRPFSLQTPLDNSKSEKSGELQDMIADIDGEENWVRNLLLQQTFDRLDSRLKYIMIARYYREHTQQQIADKLGISQVQVSRLEKQALAQMREFLQVQ